MSRIAQSAGYWGILVLLVLMMEAVALFYQYRLDYWPCLLCIHVRIWLLLLLLVAMPVLIFRTHKIVAIIGHLLMVVVGIGLLERSWQLLGIERDFITGGTCEMSLGLPAWLALDKWVPWLFEVQTPCGYTPELLLGVTMAEVLMFFSVLLLVMSVALGISLLTKGSN